MNRRLLWKLCLIVAIGTVTLFYLVNLLVLQAEEQMSYLSQEHQQQLMSYAKQAEKLYLAGDKEALRQWMDDIQERENTWAAIIKTEIDPVAGGDLDDYFYRYYGIGRGVEWIIHPWLQEPLMELKFADKQAHFLIRLPDHMRPHMFPYLGVANLSMRILIPLLMLILISVLLYRHIMWPLRQLEIATRKFSRGDFEARVRNHIGSRSDELTALASTFDSMADRISTLILNQRQLISDLSHELRTPLARLDIAIEQLRNGKVEQDQIDRVERESKQIRKLVEDTLTFAWLVNEDPSLNQESIDLVDLLDVVVEDAQFEFPDRHIETLFPDHAPLANSSHRALGQALENIIRNAMRFTPSGSAVKVSLIAETDGYQIDIIDQGPGVREENLENIFQPFFREDSARSVSSSSFGLGLALAKRQILATGGTVNARNRAQGGLVMSISLPHTGNTAMPN